MGVEADGMIALAFAFVTLAMRIEVDGKAKAAGMAESTELTSIALQLTRRKLEEPPEGGSGCSSLVVSCSWLTGWLGGQDIGVG